MCAQKLIQVNLIYHTEQKLKSKKTDMLRSIGKQSRESMQSVPRKKKKATLGRICRKERF